MNSTRETQAHELVRSLLGVQRVMSHMADACTKFQERRAAPRTGLKAAWREQIPPVNLELLLERDIRRDGELVLWPVASRTAAIPCRAPHIET